MTITQDTRPRSPVEFKLPAFSAQRIDLSQQRRGAVAHHYYATTPTASRNRVTHACAPAIMDIVEHRRLLVFALASTTSGVPSWRAATAAPPGVNLLGDLSEASVSRVVDAIERIRQPGDMIVISIHWGPT